MDLQLVLGHDVARVHHRALLAQADLARRIAGVAAGRGAGTPRIFVLRRFVGTALIRLGERPENPRRRLA